MVRNGSVILIVFLRSMMPETRKIMVRGPLVSQAARKLPRPASLRFDTNKTLPPRPPGVFAPKPSAPGRAGRSLATALVIARRKRVTTKKNHSFFQHTTFGVEVILTPQQQ